MIPPNQMEPDMSETEDYKEPSSEPGDVTWHCSEEGGGPDVGMSLGLGNGNVLWAGEISSNAYAEGGDEAKALSDDGGWWLMIYSERLPIAKFVDGLSAQEFVEKLAAALRPAKKS